MHYIFEKIFPATPIGAAVPYFYKLTSAKTEF